MAASPPPSCRGALGCGKWRSALMRGIKCQFDGRDAHFNFVGKILGPQGNTIKRLQEETGAKISVLGKGSMRDKAK
ncbi:hypothetical protein CRUP_007634, partial [Coryphaenoides rupestris]